MNSYNLVTLPPKNEDRRRRLFRICMNVCTLNMSYKKRFIRNDFATSKNFWKNKKLPFKIGEKIRNVTSKAEILKKHISFK